MSTDERYDEATVELVASELSRISVAAGYRLRDRRRPMAVAALDALATAGLLLPPGGETREEWDIWIIDHVIGRPFRSRAFAEEEIANRRAEGYTWPGEVRRRTVHVGPWEVPDDPS